MEQEEAEPMACAHSSPAVTHGPRMVSGGCGGCNRGAGRGGPEEELTPPLWERGDERAR